MLTHGANGFRFNLNLTNTTYLAASTVDQYKSKNNSFRSH